MTDNYKDNSFSALKMTSIKDKSKSLPDFRHRGTFEHLNRVEIYSVVSNTLKNSRNLNNLFNSPNVSEAFLYGYTKFSCYNYNFPIFCSRREFVRFLVSVGDHPDRRQLFVDGILTHRMLMTYPYVWRNFLSRPTMVAAGVFSAELALCFFQLQFASLLIVCFLKWQNI